MIPAFLISVESFFISIMFFFAFSPKEYIIHNSITESMMEPGIVVRTKPYSGGFLGWKAFLESLWMWDLVENTWHAFMFLPSMFKRAGGEWGAEEVLRRSSSQTEDLKTHGEPTADTASMRRDYSPYGDSRVQVEETGDELQSGVENV
jgi:hypothetical protein